MKNTILIIAAAVALALPVQAADDQKQSPSYKAGEFQVDVFGQVATPDLDSEHTSYGFGVSYSITPTLVAGVRTSFDELSGHTFENVSPRVMWRILSPIPTQKHGLYFWGGGTRTFHGCTGWSVEAGPGYSFRPFGAGFELFTEIGMQKPVTGARRGTSTYGLGIAGARLVF